MDMPLQPCLESRLVLGSWAARIDSDTTLPLDFLQDAFKQRAILNRAEFHASPQSQIHFISSPPDDDAFAEPVADDAIETTASPGEIHIATALLRVRGTQQNGSIEAIVRLKPNAAPGAVLNAHLSIAVRRLLLWAGLFYLHAGAIAWNGTASLLVGEKGGGKSTACLHLARAGAKLISEDHVLIRKVGPEFLASGSESVGRVTQRTEQHLFASPLTAPAEDFAGSLKKEFVLAEHFTCTPGVDYAYRQIFFPHVADRFAIVRLSEMEAALRLLSNARQFFRFSKLSDCQPVLEFFLGMVCRCDCYDLSLTPQLSGLDELVPFSQNG
jgi:hypothetical protein